MVLLSTMLSFVVYVARGPFSSSKFASRISSLTPLCWRSTALADVDVAAVHVLGADLPAGLDAGIEFVRHSQVDFFLFTKSKIKKCGVVKSCLF